MDNQRSGRCDTYAAARGSLRAARAAVRPFSTFLVAMVAIGVLGLAPHARAEQPVVVELNNELQFTPKVVTISAGQTVQWRNTSVLIHTVTADPEKAAKPEHVALPDGAKPFDSGNMPPQATFSHTFEVPGRYRYFCIPHGAAGMLGEIIVKGADGS